MLKNQRVIEKTKNTIGSYKTPNFISQGQGIINEIYTIFCEQNIHFKTALLLCDKRTFAIGGKKIFKLLTKRKIFVKKKFIEKSNEKTIRMVENMIKRQKYNLVIGFGGGKILDVAKLAAGKNGLKFISIPTILSNDGISSPVSVITDKNGIPVSHLTNPPYGIIIDYNIIKKAPIRHLRAGVGDLISNLSAVCDCRLAKKRKKEDVGETILKLAEIGAKRLLNIKTRNIKSKKFLECLCDGLLKSGLAMCLVGSSRPASGSEHKIGHSMDYLFPDRDILHGEQAGIATLFTMVLQKNSHFKAVKRLYKNIKFPTKLSYLKIKNRDFVKIVRYAKRIRPWRYTILEDKNLGAKEIGEISKKTIF